MTSQQPATRSLLCPRHHQRNAYTTIGACAMYSTTGARVLVQCIHHGACAAIAAGAGVMNSISGTRVSITAGAREMCSTLAHALRAPQQTLRCAPSLSQMLRSLRRQCEVFTTGADAAIAAETGMMSSTPGARAASTAGDDAMCSTTAAGAAIIVGARAMCSIGGANAAVTAGDSTMYSTTGASALQKLILHTGMAYAMTAVALSNPPLLLLLQPLRSWRDVLHHWSKCCDRSKNRRPLPLEQVLRYCKTLIEARAGAM